MSTCLRYHALVWLTPVKADGEALDFCLLHFNHAYNHRLPFLHHTSTSDPRLSRAMKFAIAAVTGAGFQHLKTQCRSFFEQARQTADTSASLRERAEENSVEVTLLSVVRLRDFQLQVLLFEYALWSGEGVLEAWASRGMSSVIEVRD